MESHNYLGIYISTNAATAVCIGPQGKGGSLLGCFSVSIEDQEQANLQTLASLLAQGCAERKLKFSEVAVALDCAMFMQHNVHSEFNDPKRIAATVKFDTEEAIATDITEVALAFEIASSDETGSKLNVFTAQRAVLSEVLEALQQYNLDPVTMEPDVGCLTRFISRMIENEEPREGETLFGILSKSRGYLVAPPTTTAEGSRVTSAARTFLVGPSQDRSKLLTRELLVTTALVEGAKPVNCLKIFDSAREVDYREVGQKVGIEAGTVDLCQAAGAEPQALEDCINPADFVIAYGAALSHRQKGHKVNFRDDFNPFEGKKIRMHRAFRFAAVSVIILLISLGVYFHAQLIKENTARADLLNRFAKDYSDVKLQKLRNGVDIKKAVRDLGNLKRKIEREKKGLDPGDKSISSKLTLVLRAFDKCAKQTNLNVKTINISANTITITGDTSSRKNTLLLFETFKTVGLTVQKTNYKIQGTRDTFTTTVEPLQLQPKA